MSANESAPHYVELLVSDSVYNVIIDNNVEGSHLELFTPEEVQGVISESEDSGTVSASNEMKNIRVYQAFKGVSAPVSQATGISAIHNGALFKTVESASDNSVLNSLSDESAQAVKTILSSQDLMQHSPTSEPSQHHSMSSSQSDNITTNSSSSSSVLKLHKCPHCDYCASTTYNLKVHINNRHTKEVKYQCNQCYFICYTKASLNYHVKSHNLDEYQSCTECAYKTHSKSGLLNHLKTHQKERPFKCPHCPYAAARKMTLKEHMEVLHNKRKDVYSCDQCVFKTNWARALKKHMKIHNGDTHNCAHCTFVSNDKSSLIEHETNVHNIEHREFCCNQCSFTTDQQYKLEDHMHKRHTENDKVLLYSCPECDYKTKWKRLIKGHHRVHTGELFRCSKCSFATITRTRLNEHEMTHLEMSERSFACPHCPYKATRQTRLNEHITNRHYPDRKALHKCDKCDFSTLWKSYMKVHKKVHTGEVFKCSRCSYATPVRAQLLRHERSLHKMGSNRITTANNLYKCAHCPYTAARKGRLSEHIHLRHNRANSEILVCSHCPFKTIWKKSLETHMSIHENERFKCNFCIYDTLSSDEYKSHMQVNHLDKGFQCYLCNYIAIDVQEFNEHLNKSHSSNNNSTDNQLGINYIDSRVLEGDDQDNLDEDYSSKGVYQCDSCEFTTATEEALKAHMITHVDLILNKAVKAQTKLVFRKVRDGAILPEPKKDIIY